MKPKKCKSCKEHFTPVRPLQSVCSPDCALVLLRKADEKIERADIKARKEKLKTRRDWMNEAQAAVNAYVRERDKDLPCISCGRFHQGQYHAGHYLSRGAHPELALEPLNIHKQCQPCNTHLSGNQINFRKGLIERIGLAEVEWLEGPHEPAKPSIEKLKAIRNNYRLMLKELKNDPSPLRIPQVRVDQASPQLNAEGVPGSNEKDC